MARAQQTRTPAASRQKRVVLITSEKGGVGKSVTARTLIEHLRASGTRVAAYDADGGVGALLRVLGSRDPDGELLAEQDPAVGIGYYNIRADDERPTLLNCVASGEPLIVHDLAGGSLADLARISDMGEGLDDLLAAFAGQGYRLIVLHLISSEVAATQSVARWLELVGDRADHVAIRNTRWGKAEADFPFWHGFVDGRGESHGGKVRRRLLEEFGGLEISLPALPSGTFAKIDADALPFRVAADAPRLTIAERSHVARYLRESAVAVEPLRPLLGL
ncbi:P-loop NTPase [Methylobacterium brachiatum]|uniref:nucleotide-binding protein n=1 Tax=Methylobacterium brachiatum TaxID=269660 RepID=UPI00244D3790|nr:P-loop NTPase [Methylobacterium brachiatum]MDH2313904.1 division plane positioning ATPase MipZ [Methylobacterium brachiatum]